MGAGASNFGQQAVQQSAGQGIKGGKGGAPNMRQNAAPAGGQGIKGGYTPPAGFGERMDALRQRQDTSMMGMRNQPAIPLNSTSMMGPDGQMQTNYGMQRQTSYPAPYGMSWGRPQPMQQIPYQQPMQQPMYQQPYQSQYQPYGYGRQMPMFQPQQNPMTQQMGGLLSLLSRNYMQ